MSRSSRSAAAAAMAREEHSNDDDDDDVNAGGRSRRSGRSRQQTVFFLEESMVRVGSTTSNDDDDDDDEASSGEDGASSNESSDEGNNNINSIPTRRKSSRSTAFRGEMKDPSNSIADLLKIADAALRDDPPANTKMRAKRRGARQAKQQRSSLEGRNKSEEEDDDDDEDGGDWDSPPAKKTTKKKASTSSKSKNKTDVVVKSPAKRHSHRRMSKRLEYPQSESSEEENSSSSEDEASEVDYSGDDDEDRDNEEEEEEIKMSKVIACKLLKLHEWKNVCAKMNTTEITNGSRWIQEVDTNADNLDSYEERFLVKWNDLSYLHCSWETEKDLVEFCEGAKTRLSTFFRKAHGGLLYDADERLDGDYFDPSWISIERILEVVSDDDDDEPAEIILDVNDPNFDSGTGRQFYIKWWNKPYSESSFEFERDLILNDVDYKESLAQYEKRMVKPTRDDMRRLLNTGDAQERKLYKIFGDKVKQSDSSREELVKEYQNTLASRVFKNGGQLRDYQAEGVTWLMSNHLNNRGSVLADEMGLGKTIQTATYVSTVANELATRGPFLVVAPLSTIPHWYREFTGWTDLNTIVYHGSANDRERAREDEFAFPGDRVQDVAFNQRYLMKVAKRWRSNWEKTWMVEVVITTPEMLITDDFAELAAIKWEILVVDEAHRLKNHNSKLAQNLRDPRFEFNHSLLLTGTPIQNNMQELWTLLNFINPDSFDNLNEFMVQYGDIKSKEKVDNLHETIRPYILRRLKEDVEKSVPPKEETLIEVELTVLQKQYYRALYEKNLKFLHRDKRPLDGPSITNLAMQLRKCCNHPFLLKGVEDEVKTRNPKSKDIELLVNSSGKFVLLDKLLPRLQADGHRVLLFSQFKIMLDIIEDYMHIRRFKFERIDGSITGMKRQAAIDRFQSKDNSGREQPFVMLLSTRAGGVGINLTAADTCIIFDSDFNPQNDLQAQARCHRIGQTKSVKIYRLLTRKTYEMQMFHMSSMKMGLDQAVLQGIENGGNKDIMTKEEVEKLLKHGAYDIFKEDQDGNSEKESNDFVSQDIDSILARRAKTVIHENTGSNSNAAGGTFSKASFKNTSSDGVAAAEIDVDDPDFWTKVVGEVKKDEAEQLGKRKRAEQSYSEKDYHKRLNAAIRYGGDGTDDDDNASTSSDWSDNSVADDARSLVFNNDALGTIAKASRSAAKERFLWGGSARSDWKQSDAELVVKSLGLFGFGNVSWASFDASLSLSKPMKLEDIKRMSWSLALMCLYEAAEDDALEAARKDEAASRKDPSKGDILACAAGNEVINVDENESPTKSNVDKVGPKDLLEVSFKQLLAANKSWADLALVMASNFSYTRSSRRDMEYVQGIMDGNHPSKSSNESNAVQSKLVAEFVSNVWPALRSRGWKNDEQNSTCFTHQNITFKSITAVLDAIPKYHPELVNIVDSLISSVKESCDEPVATARRHELDAENVTATSLKLLLMDCAPMQLLADRKRAQRITLTKRLLTKLVLLREVHKAVKSADSCSEADDSTHERNAQLCKVININHRSSLPHPEWTSQHDAVLLRAVVKHGWIDSNATCLAIGNDKAVRWGAPFEVSDQSTVKIATQTQTDSEKDTKFEAQYQHLYNTAARSVMFLQQLNETFVEVLPAPVLNELREQTVDSFCLRRDESDENWIVKESELQNALRNAEKRAGECESLPSRKKLLKRIKKIAMYLAGNLPDGEKDSFADNSACDHVTKKHGFCVIDQSQHPNALLAVMIQGLLFIKRAAKISTVKLYGNLVFGEINARLEDIRKVEESDPLIQVLEETKKGIKLYLIHQQKHARAAKNILRVMLGKDPVPPKVSTESLFPSEEEKPTTVSVTTKAATTKLTKKKAFTPADNVLVRVLSTMDDADGTNACLHLTSTEILMLTVLSSQGLPTYSDEWGASLNNPALSENDDESDDDEFRIYFYSMTHVMRAAADVWLGIARRKLQQATDSLDDTTELSDKTREKIAVLKKDLDGKELTHRDAMAYSNDPVSFAKKCISLLEAIRKNMGSVDIQYAGDKKIRQLNKSENGLGTKVLHWFSKDIQKWATSLGVIDQDGNVDSATSITVKKDHPQSYDAALMSKRDCRTVFIQIAQQTRLRSIFTKKSMEKLTTELIPRILSQSSFVMTEWEECPPWWNADTSGESNCNCQDDYDLLCGILDYGYGGFDSLLQHDFSFCRRLAAEGDEESITRSSAQVRINHLTRELHANVEREEMMQLVQKKRQAELKYPSVNGKKKHARTSGSGGVQSGLFAFFKPSSNSTQAVAKRKTPPTSPENDDSDVEIIEIDSVSIKDRANKAKSSD